MADPRMGAFSGPIGIFDSGFGGLTVMKEIARLLPEEDYIFLGDCIRCPYGPRPLEEVREFVLQICSYLASRGCKLIVIACNTATAAGLHEAQRLFDVPIVGVVVPGARAAVHMTRNRRVGVIATEGTIASGVYEDAISTIDAGIQVFSQPTPEFVRIAEAGIRFERGGRVDASCVDEEVYVQAHEEYRREAERYLIPLKEEGIDTLVLGCTHFPLIQPLIAEVMGSQVRLVSSAEETAHEVLEILRRKDELADRPCARPSLRLREYLTTDDNVEEFRRFGTSVMEEALSNVAQVVLSPRVGQRAVSLKRGKQ